jgi:hypothetical protein
MGEIEPKGIIHDSVESRFQNPATLHLLHLNGQIHHIFSSFFLFHNEPIIVRALEEFMVAIPRLSNKYEVPIDVQSLCI